MRAYAYTVAATGNIYARTDLFDVNIPFTSDFCSAHLINRGVTVEGRNATVEFVGIGASEFECSLLGHQPEPCTSANRMFLITCVTLKQVANKPCIFRAANLLL